MPQQHCESRAERCSRSSQPLPGSECSNGLNITKPKTWFVCPCQGRPTVSCKEALSALSLSIPSLPDCWGLSPSKPLRLFASTREACQTWKVMPHLKSPHADHRNRRRYRSAHNTIECLRHIASAGQDEFASCPFLLKYMPP